MRIIVLTGPFGVGKTSAATELERLVDGSLIFDPEMIGAVLHRFIPEDLIGADYQDLPVWRSLVVSMGDSIAGTLERDLVVPMNFWKFEYFSEIVGGFQGLGHQVLAFRLLASEATLRQRILSRSNDEASHEWCLSHLDSGLKAAQDPRFGVAVDTENSDVTGVARQIAQAISGLAGRGHL